MLIKPHHLKEWVDHSGVSEKITRLNVQSLELDHEIDELLNRNTKSRWKTTDWGDGGWFVSGIEPKTGNQTYVGGQFKPDKPVGDRKYLGISDSAANPLFLNTGEKDYWKTVIEDKTAIVITEGAKKAGCLLTIGLPAISLSGVSTGQKLGRLRSDLLPFFAVGRRVYLCFDSDVMVKKPVQQALDKLGRLIAEKGAMVSVINLPEKYKGVDDFIVAKGPAVFLSLVDDAQTFEEWRKHLNKPKQLESQPEKTWVFETPKQRELRILRETYAHRLRLNMRGFDVELDGKTVEPDYLYLQCLERDGIEVKKDQIIDSFLFFASENQYDPVAEYLNECYAKYGDSTIHLLDDASDRYMHTTEPVYNTYIRKTLIGGVLRTFEAGSQFETALILFSKTQGFFKSTFWRVLGGDWFDDTVQGFDRDERQKLHQYWIEEFGEIERVSTKHDVSQVKAFMSNRADVFRVPFGRKSKSYPRKFILVGSTNLPEVLQDSTGDRRFWIIKLDQPIDIEQVKEDRDKLWAAAVALYKRGESAFLPRDLDMVRAELNKEHRRDDPWEESVAEYVRFFDQVKMIDVLKSCLEIPIERHERKTQDRVAAILRNLGFEKVHTMHGKVWKKLESYGSDESIQPSETILPMTLINKDESFINKGSSDLPKTPHDSLTHDSYDSDKNKNFQVEKSKTKSLKVGDRIRIKSPHFLAGKIGELLSCDRDKTPEAIVGGEGWAVTQYFSLSQLEKV